MTASDGVSMWLLCVTHFVQIFLYKCFDMAPKNISIEEKVRVLAWAQVKVVTNEIVRHTGQSKSFVSRVFAAAQGLLPSVWISFQDL